MALAVTLVWRRRNEVGGQGPWWFLVWIAAGFLVSFSLITGLSIGLFILPIAAAVLIWAARRAPHLPEALGFVAGIVATALLVAVLGT